VRKLFLNLKIVIIFCVSFSSREIYAQLGFCQGNSGDPIFTEDFGSGTNYGPALPTGTTTYSFVGNSGPQDGQYSIGRNTFSYGWSLPSDHTGDTNGKALIVNASFTSGEFYKTTVNGLCENTTYEFSSWLINILPSSGCGGNGIPVNVRFEIWDITDTNLLASGDTGNIFGTNSPTWDQYGLVFQTLPTQTSVILKMKNNGVGGCGNDLAIDDIVFRSCGDSIDVNDGTSNNSVTLCSSQTPYSETITALPDNVVFSNHFYQWQSSTDGMNWVDIVGETNASLNITGIIATSYYRAKVAEYAANLNNADCITFSDVYEIIVNQAPPPPTTECWETATFDDTSCSWTVTGIQPTQPTGLECWQTTVFNNTTCVWDISGTQPAQPTLECWETAIFNTTTCSWDITGTQPMAPTGLDCWQTATFNTTICDWEVTGTQPQQPTTECWETVVFNTATCVWDITGTQPTQPTVECWETTLFNNITCTWDITGTQPIEPTGLQCWETAVFDNTLCVWEVTGVQPEQPTTECWETVSFNTTSCSWEITGTQPTEPTNLECWEMATFNDANCSWEVSGSQPTEPTNLECWQTAVFNEELCDWDIIGTQPIDYREEFLFLCEGGTLELEAMSTINNPDYDWSSGEMSQSIVIDSAGVYEVEVTDGCSTEIIIFNVELIEIPIIENIESDGSSITIDLSSEGDYLYSLNGLDYQFSNVFSNTPSGSYTIFVKSNICETVVEQDYFHFFIQKFMTPNSDGKNDFFSLNVTQYFAASEVYIYDRYGKLLFSAIDSNVNWDGTFNGNELPTSDYWYRIVLDGKEFKGHFTLKR
jgi:gliding motility-associated-like protein